MRLSISDLKVWVHLGFSPEERYQSQLVSLDIHLFFSDNEILNDVLSYSKIVRYIKMLSESKPFSFMDHLTAMLHEGIKNLLSYELKHSNVVSGLSFFSIEVNGHKLDPLVPEAHEEEAVLTYH
jgi:dihydroneopterin aldolase